MNAPSRIGPYPIERELGRGGMGIVYLGRDTRLGRAVAIKVLPDAVAADPERVARFQREAQLLASLNHPQIAGIYGLEESEGHRFLALEYVEGPTLAERLTRGPLPLDEALEVARQIAAALEAAHDSGVIHRDLKPGNVKLTPAGDVKVLDFGLAKGAGSAESSPDLSQSPTMTYAATGVGVILGTAAYMSPEQARGKVVDRRTDIWSFGCVLWEMLTGRQLFAGETVSDTIAKILEREPDWKSLPPAVPEKIRELLRRCLEKDARKRLRDIGDARIELEDLVHARSAKSRAAAADRESARRAGSPRALMVAYGVAAVAVALAALAMVRPSREPEAPVRLTVTEPRGASMIPDAVEVALSPDGRTLVYLAADSASQVRLWARPLGRLEGAPIPGTDNASKPFWSADSRWVGFFADGKLKKARLDGGVEVVCDAPNGRGASWSRAGTIVFAPAGEGPLLAVSASGGEPHPVTTLDSTKHQTAHRFPWFLPDGKHFLFVALPGGARGFDVMIGSLDGKKARFLLRADSAPTYDGSGDLVYLRDRNLVAQRFDPGSMRLKGDPVALPDSPAFSQSTAFRAATVANNGSLAYMNGIDPTTRLSWLDRSGRVVGTVPVPPAEWAFPSLSPDERTVAVTRTNGPNQSDEWLIDIERGVSTRFTYGPANNSFGIWSRDGSRIVFESDRNGPFDIFIKAASGATPETALVKGGSQFKHPAGWSPDGRLLAYYQMDPATGFDIWVTPTDHSGPPRPYLATPFQESVPEFSLDGRWLLYESDESGRQEAYVQSFPTPGRKYQLTTGGCAYSIWRGDGKEILILTLDDQILGADVIESGDSFRATAPHVLFRAPGVTATGFAVTRDGQRFLIPVPAARTLNGSVTVALHWSADLAAHGADRR